MSTPSLHPRRVLALVAAASFLLCTALASAQGALVSAPAQTSRDFTLRVSRVVLPQAGFVVVYPINRRGDTVFRSPLGSAYVEAGTHDDVAVPLARGRIHAYGYEGERQNLMVMLYRDDGDGVFSGHNGTDTPFLQGAVPLEQRVSFAEGASLTARDQTLADGKVTVQEVFAIKPGFVVVHALDDAGRVVAAPPLGVEPVPAGRTRYVHVALDATLLARAGYGVDAKAVSIMLHADDGDGAYAFPGPDAPVPGPDGPLAQEVALSLPGPAAPSIGVGDSAALDLGPAGIDLPLADVTNPQPAFLAVYLADDQGQPRFDRLVGRSGSLSPGSRKKVTIHIRGDIVPLPGQELVAVLHADDGDHALRYPESDPLLQVDGAPYLVPFTVR